MAGRSALPLVVSWVTCRSRVEAGVLSNDAEPDCEPRGIQAYMPPAMARTTSPAATPRPARCRLITSATTCTSEDEPGDPARARPDTATLPVCRGIVIVASASAG